MEYLDFGLFKGTYGVANEYSDIDAIILAIRNLLLSRPGNFPFNPSLGINIKKYQFDLMDDVTISNIESELQDNVNKYIPSISDIDVFVRRVVDDDSGKVFLGIAIKTKDKNGENIDATFLFDNNGDTLKVFNEIR